MSMRLFECVFILIAGMGLQVIALMNSEIYWLRFVENEQETNCISEYRQNRIYI